MFYWLTWGGLSASMVFNGSDQPYLRPLPMPLSMSPGASFKNSPVPSVPAWAMFWVCLCLVLDPADQIMRWADLPASSLFCLLLWSCLIIPGLTLTCRLPACLPALMLDLPCCYKLAWYLDFCLIPKPSLLSCSGLAGQGPDHWLRDENQLLKSYNYCTAAVVCKCDNVILTNSTLKQISLGKKQLPQNP